MFTLQPYQRRFIKARLVQGDDRWLNWHVNRGRIGLTDSDRAMRRYKRQVSWRRML